MSYGKEAVGASFSPSGRADIARAKELAAELFDLVEQAVPADDGTLATARKRKLRDAALHEIVTAAMWAVKALTHDREE